MTRTSVYRVRPDAARCADYKTVIVDELDAHGGPKARPTIDALEGVERLILVGDHQLPRLERAGLSSISRGSWLLLISSPLPRVAGGYAELAAPPGRNLGTICCSRSIFRRQLDPGADEVWSRIEAGSSPKPTPRAMEHARGNSNDAYSRSLFESSN